MVVLMLEAMSFTSLGMDLSGKLLEILGWLDGIRVQVQPLLIKKLILRHQGRRRAKEHSETFRYQIFKWKWSAKLVDMVSGGAKGQVDLESGMGRAKVPRNNLEAPNKW